MKALSIMQPWAWLVVNGHKDIENRDWRSDNPGLKYRGDVLIHTGLRFDDDFTGNGLPDIVRQIPTDDDLPRGGIVGIAEIVDCVKDHPSPWFFGRYGFVLRNARPLEFKPCVGRLDSSSLNLACNMRRSHRRKNVLPKPNLHKLCRYLKGPRHDQPRPLRSCSPKSFIHRALDQIGPSGKSQVT